MIDLEKRIFKSSVELRSAPDDESEQTSQLIVGQASVYNSLSENLGGFREVFKPGAFADVLTQDVRGLFNHDKNYILGRTSSGTLRLTDSESALGYEIDAPDTQLIRDLVMAPIKRGDINQSSFAFKVAPGGDDWTEDADGTIVRTIHKISKLFDVSPVTFPAYPSSAVSARCADSCMDALNEYREKILNQRAARERFLQLYSV
ncbi:HK97 family phage prohead protease [Aliidiomarina sp. Khilg15.8]